jgi:hypothetical protein
MIIQAFNLTGAAFCFRAPQSPRSGPGKLTFAFGGKRFRLGA